MTRIRRWLVVTLLALCAHAPQAWAQPASPVGLWRQVDDKTGHALGTVRIFEQDGILYGRVERILVESERNRLCENCPGDMRGKPVQGLVFLRGLRRSGDEWSGGTIVDPQTGSSYRCSLHLVENGQALVVRGYVGISLLGRSQTWRRDG